MLSHYKKNKIEKSISDISEIIQEARYSETIKNSNKKESKSIITENNVTKDFNL